jgi:conflict system pore-forming effector with SLATT domain
MLLARCGSEATHEPPLSGAAPLRPWRQCSPFPGTRMNEGLQRLRDRDNRGRLRPTYGSCSPPMALESHDDRSRKTASREIAHAGLLSEFEYNVGHHRQNARATSKAQYQAANVADRRNYYIGLPAIVLGVVVSTSIFAALDSSPNSREKIIAGTLSLLAATLAAVQTFFNFSAKAKAHRAAGAQYGDIRRRCEFLLFQYHLIPDGPRKARFAVEQYGQLLDRLADLAANSPDVADRFWKRAQESNKGRDDEEQAQGRDSYLTGIGGALLDDADLGSIAQPPKLPDP